MRGQGCGCVIGYTCSYCMEQLGLNKPEAPSLSPFEDKLLDTLVAAHQPEAPTECKQCGRKDHETKDCSFEWMTGDEQKPEPPPAEARPREFLEGWMILEVHCEDMSEWSGVISYPDPTGATLAWESPTKMIEYAALEQLQRECEILRNVLAVARIANRTNEDIRVTHALNRWDKRNG